MRQSIRCWVLAAGLAGLAAPALAQTLVVAALKTPGGVDGDALKPGTQNAVTQVYEGLTAYARTVDADGVGRLDFTKVVPHLAEGDLVQVAVGAEDVAVPEVHEGAGLGAGYNDEAFVRAGARIAADADAVFQGSQLIIKV